jgi:DNA polymerase
MHAFLRFRRVGENQFAAWFKPIHRILPLTARWFADRFAVMRWTIMTPDDSATWDGETITFGPGVPREQAPAPDELEDLWCAYYAATFNPARINLKAMQTEMPKQYWSNLPELAVLDELLLSAPAKLSAMAARAERMAGPQVPPDASLAELLAGIRGCEGCALYAEGTRTVSGKGPPDAGIALVAAQPDAALRAFGGSGASILHAALEAAGLSEDRVYRTHAVKHAPVASSPGQRSARATPQQVAACTAWLRAELGQVRPQIIVALGPIAARALLGRAIRVEGARGRLHRAPWATRGVCVTVAPEAIHRAADARAERLFEMLVEDLAAVVRMGSGKASGVSA